MQVEDLPPSCMFPQRFPFGRTGPRPTQQDSQSSVLDFQLSSFMYEPQAPPMAMARRGLSYAPPAWGKVSLAPGLGGPCWVLLSCRASNRPSVGMGWSEMEAGGRSGGGHQTTPAAGTEASIRPDWTGPSTVLVRAIKQ